MRYAILAAGEGSRLMAEGVEVPKPLVKIGDERLIDRLIRIFLNCGAREIAIVINERHPQTNAYLLGLQQQGLPLRLVVKSTPSSMHSLYALSSLLEGDEPFVLTTVDTIFREAEFHAYVSQWQQLSASGVVDGLMGVTDYIDDEKPLFVTTDDHLSILSYLDADPEPHFVSGGIYGLTPQSLEILRACIEKGESRMRNFQRALVANGYRLQAWPFSKVLDVDHTSDILKAEKFLSL